MSVNTKQPEQTKAPVAAPEPDLPPEALLPPRQKKSRKKYIALGVVVLAIAAVVVVPKLLKKNGPAQTNVNYTTDVASKRSITVTLSGSGTLQAADSYSVTALIEGDITKADFEEGDTVEKDTVLYQIDSSSVANNIERAELSLAQSQRNYNRQLSNLDDLKLKADKSGTVVTLDVEVGDSVQVGQTVATIRDSDTMRLEVPFASDDAAGFSIGQPATVTLDGSFETLSGTVSKIAAVDEVLEGNRMVRKVTIDVRNPGGISTTQTATAQVGGAASGGAGTFTYREEQAVTAKAAGDVAALNVKEGDRVSAGQTLITLSSDTLSDSVKSSADSIREAELSLDSQYDTLDKYSITSPIAGTIIEKNYKQGDKMESGKVLCTIFDLSYLSMDLNIDELDINQVQVGQSVQITAEAVPGKVYTGVVTKVNINGTTAGGVTSYPVTIRIDETEGLLPGMNVDAEIIVQTADNVLSIPADALSRGNRVLVKGSDPVPEGGQPVVSDAPAGYHYVDVTPGVSDGSYIEIQEGLSEGEEVAIIKSESSSMGMYGGMMGPVVVESGPPPEGNR